MRKGSRKILPQDCLVRLNGRLYIPKFRRGDMVKRRGVDVKGKIEGWTFECGVEQFNYYIENFGAPIPEDELYKFYSE